MKPSTIDFLMKIKGLADGGVDGEQKNAQKILEAMLLKYNISIEDLESCEPKDFWLKVPESKLQFLRQVIHSEIKNPVLWAYKNRKESHQGITCTQEQYIAISNKFEFFYQAYEKELRIFYSAFIQKNKLYAIPDGTESDDTMDEATKYKMMNMMESIDRHIMTKQLDTKTQ